MARGDGTGPAGMGPMTGRAAGHCAGNETPGFVSAGWGQGRGLGASRGLGRGLGRGRGFGRGQGSGRAAGGPDWGLGARAGSWRQPAFAPQSSTLGPAPDQEARVLKSQADYLAQQLEGIKARLSELEDESCTEA